MTSGGFWESFTNYSLAMRSGARPSGRLTLRLLILLLFQLPFFSWLPSASLPCIGLTYPEHMGAVRKEMSIMRLLVHPHIIRLYEVVETKDRWYAVMEHAEVGPCL